MLLSSFSVFVPPGRSGRAVSAGLRGMAAQLEAGERWCLGGGEDFELVLALPPSWAEALLKALPGASRIGSLVEAEPGLVCWQESGEPLAATESGFTHFR